MFKTLEDFYTESKKYVNRFDTFANKHELVEKVMADHISYKCASKESFEHVRSLFENESAFVYQSIISNRRIAYIKLKRGIETVLGTISFLELSDQKPDNSQQELFDHIEAYATAFSYEDMIEKFEASEKVIKVERPHHTTHDVDIGEGFLFRCTRGSLLEKIKTTEFL